MSGNLASQQRFLFLQGPPGPFFRQLAAKLAHQGYDAGRINLCGGDRYDWRGQGLDFRGAARDWPAFVTEVMVERKITDLLLFGDCRPPHRLAIQAAHRLGVKVHVFEEGYLRPDWVTLERDGVNGHSNLSRNAEWFRQIGAALPPLANYTPLKASFRRRAGEAFCYFASTVLAARRFPHFRSHRPDPAWAEALGWLRKLAVRHLARPAFQDHCGLGGNYFLFPLQLNSDHQLRVHSPYGGLERAIEHVITSFAAASTNALLVVKEHPLDNSLVDWRAMIAMRAESAGVGDRVLYVEGGDIAGWVSASLGVVTVNSTAATFALSAGIPVIALGEAVYDLDGITDQQGLDGFWTNPQAPDADLFDAFCRVLVDRCLVRGGYLGGEALDLLVDGAASRLTPTIKAVTAG